MQGSRFLGEYDDAGGARDLGIRGFTRLINGVGAGRRSPTAPTASARSSGAPLDHAARRGPLLRPEIIIEASRNGLRMLEVPVHIRSREVGTSKKPRGSATPAGFLGVIVRSWLRARRSRSEPQGAA